MEKPGAPTVKELQGMKDEAEKAGVGVLMGYNKVRDLCYCLLVLWSVICVGFDICGTYCIQNTSLTSML